MAHQSASQTHSTKAFWSGFDTERHINSSPAPENSKKAPAKRIRIPIACVNCRHKKIKCDGQTPCSHCEKSRAECIYPVATKPVNHEYVETLENRLKSVESHLQGLLSMGAATPQSRQGNHQPLDLGSNQTEGEGASSSAAATSLAASTLPTTGDAAARARSQKQYSKERATHTKSYWTSSELTGTMDHTGDNIDEQEQTFIADTTMDVLGALMGNLTIARDGCAKFLSRPDERKEQSYIDKRSYRSSELSDPSTTPELSTLDWEMVEPPRPYIPLTSLLPSQAIGVLIDIYFKSTHTFLPLLHRTSFLTLCQDGEYRVPPFLLAAMCAIASRHATKADLQRFARLRHLSNHHFFFDHARALLDTFIDIPRISTLQGLLLLTYYQVKEKRPGQFFRARTYLNMAIRMALDMGLAKDLHKNIEEIEASHTGDSVSTTTSISPSTRLSVHLNKASVNANSTGVKNSRSNNSPHRKKLAVMLQERRLAWLACFFLDGLSNSLLGFDYSVTHVHLEMRKLIREANWTIDTTQGATLIFWYLHLDLIQLYRRICEMYRSTVLATTKQGEGLAMMTVLRGTEKLSIEHALKTWISALPAHLVYTAQSSQSSTTASNDQSSKSDASVPSYYTLYLHRFYFSIRLLLYRPLIASKSHRGLLSDPSSAISQCTSAAALLTEIGELIFQNYSWPWPGCGLFAYHMVQAAEIHIYLMVSRAQPGAHDLFNRTMDLIESYATLVKLPSLEKDVVAVRQAVDNYVKANDPMPSLSRPTPSSILLQIQQYQQQQQAQDQKRHQTEEYAANTRATVATPEYPYLNAIPACMSPTTPIIAQLAQQHLHINPSHHHPQPVIQSELAGGASGETKGDTHLFLPPTSSCTLFSPIPTTGAETIVPTDLFHIPPSESSNSFSVNSLGPNATSQVLRQQHSPLSSFLNDIEARALYTQADHDIFDPMQPSQQQQGYESSYSYLQPPVMSTPHHPIDDLINLGGTQRDQTAQLSSSNEAGPHSLRRPLATAMATGAATAASDVQSNNLVHQTSQSLLPLSPIPPLKPPKRIFPQSTGSTNSSNRSLSQRPPVPKKPTRFTTDADDSHAQSSSWSSLLRLPYQLQQPTYSHSHQYHDSDPLPPALSSPAVTAQMNRRPIKVLQAQSQLYGQGGFKSSVAQNQRGARGSNGRDDYQQEEAHFEWTHSDTNEYSAVEYMKFNQHLRNPDLLPNRPRIL